MGIRLKEVDYSLIGDVYVSNEPSELVGLQQPEIDYDELVKRLEEGNENYQVIQGSNGRKYETAVFNAGQADVATILEPSTSFSSLYKNPGNFLETAVAATENPGARYLYVASFGNHPTGHMSDQDLEYVSKTGRYTTGNHEEGFRALPSVEQMAEALVDHDLNPTHVSANVEAGRLLQ